MGRLVCLAATAVMAWAASSAAQQSPPPGKFDGKYTGTMKCTPSGNFRFNGITIRGDTINVNFAVDGGNRKSCSAKINPDGTFSNSNCDLPVTGKFVGEKLEYSIKGDRFCDISATREKG
jgi:hypothetical protein